MRTNAHRARTAALLCAGPGLLWIAVFLALPGLLLLGLSVLERGAFGQILLEPTLSNYTRLLGWDVFGFDPVYLLIVMRSAAVATVTTAVCAALAYPLAFFIAAQPQRWRTVWLLIIIAPSWVNLVIRTYAWIIVLGPDSPVSRAARWLGWLDAEAVLQPSEIAVYIGMVNVFLPFMALPLYAAVERLDFAQVEAARDLYADRIRVFWHVILPQTRSGLAAGIVLTLAPAFGMFVVSDILGGAKTALIGNAIQQQFGPSRDWPFGAALSSVVIALTLLALYLYARAAGERGMQSLVGR